MSRIGIGANIIQPNAQCMNCKYWKSAKSPTDIGYCKAGYCKKDFRKRGARR